MRLRFLIESNEEEDMLDDKPKDDTKKKSEFKGFAEGRAKFEVICTSKHYTGY